MNTFVHAYDENESNQSCDIYVFNAKQYLDINQILEMLQINLNELYDDKTKDFKISRRLLNYLSVSENVNAVREVVLIFIRKIIQDFFDNLEKYEAEMLLESWIKLKENIDKVTKYFSLFNINFHTILSDINFPKSKSFYDELINKIMNLMKFRNYKVDELIKFLYMCNLEDFNLHQKIEIKTNFLNLKEIYSYLAWLKDLFPNEIYEFFLKIIIQNSKSFSKCFFKEVTQFTEGITLLFNIYNYNNNLDSFFSELENIFHVQKSILLFLTNILLINDLPTKLRFFIYKYIDNFEQNKFSFELAHYINIRFLNLKYYISQKELEIYYLYLQKISSPELFYNLHKNLLIQRLINHKKYSNDADYRFSIILNDSGFISIIKDFREHSLKINQECDKKIILSLFYKKLFPIKDLIHVNYSCDLEFLNSYEIKHDKKFPNTKIKWDFESTRCIFQVNNIRNLKTISCNGIFGILFVELNYTNNINKIIERTQIKREIIESCIKYLERIELIKCIGDNIEFMTDYKDETIILPSLKYSENNIIQQNYTSAQIESFIMRYLKINGKRDENEIYSIVLYNFPSISHENISKRIDSLISKDYVIRDEENALIINF